MIGGDNSQVAEYYNSLVIPSLFSLTYFRSKNTRGGSYSYSLYVNVIVTIATYNIKYAQEINKEGLTYNIA